MADSYTNVGCFSWEGFIGDSVLSTPSICFGVMEPFFESAARSFSRSQAFALASSSLHNFLHGDRDASLASHG